MSRMFDLEKIRTNEPVIVMELIDISGSMRDYSKNMVNALEEHKRDILKLDEVNTISFQRTDFGERVWMGEFLHMSEFSTDYCANGGSTTLYGAIDKVASNFFEEGGFYDSLIEEGKIPNIIFTVFSDGGDNNSTNSNYENSKIWISKLNDIGATTAFIAFDDAVGLEIAKDLGFQAKKPYEGKIGLEEAFACISRSVAKTSKSKVALGSGFFDNV